MHSKITCQLLPLPHKSGLRSWGLKTNHLGWTSLPCIWLLSQMVRLVEVTFLNVFCAHEGFLENKRLSHSHWLSGPASLHKIACFRVKSSQHIAFKLLLLKRQLKLQFLWWFLQDIFKEIFSRNVLRWTERNGSSWIEKAWVGLYLQKELGTTMPGSAIFNTRQWGLLLDTGSKHPSQISQVLKLLKSAQQELHVKPCPCSVSATCLCSGSKPWVTC